MGWNEGSKELCRTSCAYERGLESEGASVGHFIRISPLSRQLQDGLHLIHGQDVARAILAVHLNPSKTVGQRWLLSDGRVYDWWDIASAWSEEKAQWVRELMRDESVRALPREISTLGRALDSRDFWDTFELVPVKARV